MTRTLLKDHQLDFVNRFLMYHLDPKSTITLENPEEPESSKISEKNLDKTEKEKELYNTMVSNINLEDVTDRRIIFEVLGWKVNPNDNFKRKQTNQLKKTLTGKDETTLLLDSDPFIGEND